MMEGENWVKLKGENNSRVRTKVQCFILDVNSYDYEPRSAQPLPPPSPSPPPSLTSRPLSDGGLMIWQQHASSLPLLGARGTRRRCGWPSSGHQWRRHLRYPTPPTAPHPTHHLFLDEIQRRLPHKAQRRR